MITNIRLLTTISICIFLQACYSFSGISIDYAVYDTYFVEQFENNALNAPPALPQEVTERLKEKIRTDSRLVFDSGEPDIQFRGTLVDFRVTSEAPQPGEFSAINRLTIVTAVEYIDNVDPSKNWKSNFSFFYDFPSTVNLTQIQDEAIDEILDQIMEDIFNKAFTSW